MPPKISALLLAAGLSTRMGQPKALLPLQDQPAILRCLAALPHADLGEITVILNRDSNAVASLLADQPVKIMVNTLPASEMAQSVRLGVQAMSHRSPGALICLVDHPLVQPETVSQLVAAALKAPDRIIIPTFQGRRGHPSFFPRALLIEIYQGFNLREIIARHPDKMTVVPVADEGVVLDLDTPADYQEICRRLAPPT